MLTGASGNGNGKPSATPLEDVKGTRNTQHFIAGGAGALVQDSMGKPWSGDYVFSSGDLIEDLTHNFFLETGARNNKLKVYEMVDHPAARALTGYLLVRGGVHQVAYARALENLTGAQLMKLFPSPRIPTAKIPECKPHRGRRAPSSCTGSRRTTTGDRRRLQRQASGAGEDLMVIDEAPEGFPPMDLPSQTDVFAPGYEPDEIGDRESCATRRGSRTPLAVVAN
jgi:Mn-containing catalase